jgi:exonuclease VII small subunit
MNELTFEAGYERLRTIAERINKEEVPVSEMCDLFAEGKGLEQALTGYLDTQTQRVEAIERGEGIQAFRIVAPTPDTKELVVDEDDFVPAPAVPNGASAAGDDDIPF